MSFMFEVFYGPPANPQREAAVTEQVAAEGGRLDCREMGDQLGRGAICLTFEFEDFDAARKAADRLRQQGEHVEGPFDYGS
jgi:hypothetical protein